MKYLKNVLLATSLIATTLGMSMSANAGAIIQQDIYADVFIADANSYGITTGDQWIGSITFNTDLADDVGFLDTDSTMLDISVGSLMLTLADGDAAFFGDPIIAGFDPLDFTSGLEFLLEFFELGDAFAILDVGPLSGNTFLVEDFITGGLVVGETRLGAVTYVPEPSALVLMLAGLGLLVRRKVAAK